MSCVTSPGLTHFPCLYLTDHRLGQDGLGGRSQTRLSCSGSEEARQLGSHHRLAGSSRLRKRRPCLRLGSKNQRLPDLLCWPAWLHFGGGGLGGLSQSQPASQLVAALLSECSPIPLCKLSSSDYTSAYFTMIVLMIFANEF